MQSHPVDKEMLKRFHEGTCTPSEREQVLRWLEEDDGEILFLSGDRMDAVEERIWTQIDPHSIKRARTVRLLTWSGIAASLLVLISAFLFQHANQGISTKLYSLGGNSGNSLELSGLKFRSVGNSNATVTSNLDSKTGDLTFCGVVEISNNSNADVHYTLKYGCKAPGLNNKKVVLKKGGKYIAMRDNYNFNELVIIKKEHLLEFPDALPAGFERI